MNNYTNLLILIISVLLVSAACSEESERSTAQRKPYAASTKEKWSKDKTIIEIVSERSDLSTLAKTLKRSELDSMLEKSGSYTLFAPTNEGFEFLPDGSLEELMLAESKNRLADLLKVHLVEKSLQFGDMRHGQNLTSAEGVVIPIRKRNGNMTVSQAVISSPDIQASNGVIHIVDRFLVHVRPPGEFR